MTDDYIERRQGRWALVILVGVVLLIPAAVGVMSYRFLRGRSQTVAPEAPQQAAVPAPIAELPPVEPTVPPRADLPRLDASDAFVRKLAERLSANPAWAKWLLNDGLVRRFVASVDNVAEGRAPKAHLGFLAPKGEFRARESRGEATIDPATYRRYDVVADVVGSLDAAGCAKLYQETRPLFRDAYRDLGYPDRNFDDTLKKAIQVLLATPEPRGDLRLRRAVKSWKLADSDYEALSPAQKQLLRFGPENMAKIKRKLREILEALG
jgi:Protein of unknown function (DUF3014)